MNKSNKKGFTLAELLIVVAIIAVLVAIAIPVFTAQLEKARQATDAANMRAAYAEAQVDSLQKDGNGGTATTDVEAKAQDVSYKEIGDPKIGDKKMSELITVKDKTWSVSVDKDGKVTATQK